MPTMDGLPTELLCRLIAQQDFESKRSVLPLVCKRWNDLLSNPLQGMCIWGDITLDLSVFGAIMHHRYEVMKPQYASLWDTSIALSSYATSFFQRFVRWLGKRAKGVRNVTICGFISNNLPKGRGNETIVVDNVKCLVTAYFFSSWFPEIVRALPHPEHHICLDIKGDLVATPFMRQPEYLPILQQSISELRYEMVEHDPVAMAALNLLYIGQLTGLESLEIVLKRVDTGVTSAMKQLSSLTDLKNLKLSVSDGRLNLLSGACTVAGLESLSVCADLGGVPGCLTQLTDLKELRIEGVVNKYPMNVCNPGFTGEWWPATPGGLVGLESATFRRCGIVDLPASLGLLSKITELDLSLNGLRGYQNVAVIGVLTKLRKLNLSGNLFSNTDKLGQLCELHDLTDIDLSNNVFLFVPKVLLNLKKLVVINMAGNHITLTKTLFGLAELRDLRKLDIGLNTSTRSISDALLVKYQQEVLAKFPANSPCKLSLTVTETRSLWWA